MVEHTRESRLNVFECNYGVNRTVSFIYSVAPFLDISSERLH